MKLKVFDFDGTLFRSPDPPPGNWERSLSPPFVPQIPGPRWWVRDSLREAQRAIADPNTYTVLMTGRSSDLFTDRVYELLGQQRLSFDEIHLTPPQTDTFTFKSFVLEELLARMGAFLDHVYFWDDDAEKMAGYAKITRNHQVPCSTHLVTSGASLGSSFIASVFVNDERKTSKECSMSDQELRGKLIRLAYADPTIRGELLPLIREAKEDVWNRILREEREKERAREQAEQRKNYDAWRQGEIESRKEKLGDRMGDVFKYLQRHPSVSDSIFASYLTKSFFPLSIAVENEYAKKVKDAFLASGEDLGEFGKQLEKQGMLNPRWRRVLRRWLFASEDRWAMLSQEDRDIAGYALRYVQERQGWHNAVTRLRTGFWSWPQFEQRARGILRGYPGTLDPQLTDYIINKLKNLFKQGNWDLLDHFTPRAAL